MNSDELRKILLQAFSEEAPELLDRCERALLDLEQADAVYVFDCLEAMKRALHSLKGSASAIGRGDLRDVCHAMEECLLSLADKLSRPDRVSPAGNGVAVEQLDALHDGLRYLRSGCQAPDEYGDPLAVLAVLAGQPLSAVAAAATSAMAAVANAVMADTAVMADDMEPESAPAPLPARHQPERDTDKERPLAFADTIRVAIPKIDNLQSCIGELVAVRLQQEDSLGKLGDVRELIHGLQQQWRHVTQDLREARSLLPKALATRLDNRMTGCSGSLKTLQRSLSQLTSQMASQTGQVCLLSEAMDSGIRAIRMLPLGPFLEGFRTVARDAARSLGKSVVLEYEDKGVEVDRLVLEHIREPLLHMVRNAVSHGIESPAMRRQAGKPEAGRIVLRAELSGEYVAIAVMDDGAGFQRERIFRKARELGLVRHEEELTEEKMLEVVTRPGFSTAQSADTVAGRGIGMDVVATMVYELGGTLELQTMEGLGTCMTMRVPSSLATTQGLVVQVGNQRYGIVLDTVERIVRSTLDALAAVEGKPVLYLDEQPLAITSLAAVLGLELFEPRQVRKAYPVVVLRMGSQRLAVIVDDIPGEIPMIVKPLGESLAAITLYAGGAILADGSVLPVVESRQVIQRVAQQDSLRLRTVNGETVPDEVAEPVVAGLQAERSILVVDDSITTRTLERNILEAAGYRVFVATDGVEALDMLRAEDSIALLVTDMEMPRMNGLELCRAVRGGRHARLPIIMVTSIGSEHEKAEGMRAGADAYIVKGHFQQEHFLSTVRRFVQA